MEVEEVEEAKVEVEGEEEEGEEAGVEAEVEVEVEKVEKVEVEEGESGKGRSHVSPLNLIDFPSPYQNDLMLLWKKGRSNVVAGERKGNIKSPFQCESD